MVWEWDSVSVSALEKGAKHLAQMDHTNLQGLHFTYTPDMQVNFQQSQEFPGHTHLEAPSSRFWSVFFFSIFPLQESDLPTLRRNPPGPNVPHRPGQRKWTNNWTVLDHLDGSLPELEGALLRANRAGNEPVTGDARVRSGR